MCLPFFSCVGCVLGARWVSFCHSNATLRSFHNQIPPLEPAEPPERDPRPAYGRAGPRHAVGPHDPVEPGVGGHAVPARQEIEVVP